MLKTTLKIAALSAVSLTLLSACGAASKAADLAGNAANDLNRLGGGNGGSSPTPSQTFLADPAAAVADGITSGKKTGTIFGVGIDRMTDTAISEVQDTFSIEALGQNDLTVTISGDEYKIEPLFDNTSYRSNHLTISSWGSFDAADIREVVDGTHETVQGDYLSYILSLPEINTDVPSRLGTDVNYTVGYTTVGTQTLASVVETQTATATYKGHMIFDIDETKQTGTGANLADIDSFYSGELTMTVNFSADTVEGTANLSKFAVDNFLFSPENLIGVITFASAPISGNGFAGTFTMDDALRTDIGLTNNPTGNYAGNFFGPAADDLAGVMRFNGTQANGTLLGLGGFRGDRQVPTQ